jgi:hypothetical protein
MHNNRLTADQLAALAPGPRSPLESRFDRDDGSQIGDRGWLLDTDHPDTIRALAAADRGRAEERIDVLADTWRRDRNPDTLRRLHAAITDHLTAETTTQETAP